MADDRLTNLQIVRLAASITAHDMAAIAEGYLDMRPETVMNRKFENRGDGDAFNRDILQSWANRNPGPDQVKRLHDILRSAAMDSGLLNLSKVEDILGSSKKEDKSPELAAVHLLKLCARITSVDQLRRLAVVGLKIPAYRVDMHINNNPNDLRLAAYNLLGEWRNTQINSRIAFQNLCQALERSGMNPLLNILQDDSVSGESRIMDAASPAKIIKQSDEKAASASGGYSESRLDITKRQAVTTLVGLTKLILKQKVRIVEIVNGSAVTIQALHSDVILHVPDGVYGVILGNIHTDHWRFRHLVRENDCIIGPMCEFHFKGSDIPPGARFKILVPHIVSNVSENSAHIKVKHQGASHEVFVDAFPTPIDPPQDSKAVYYDVKPDYIEISSAHFCKYLVTDEAIRHRSRNVEMLVFSKMNMGSRPRASVRFYFGSPLYKYEDYSQKPVNGEEAMRRLLSERAKINLSHQEYDKEKSHLHIIFYTTANEKDERWTAKPHSQDWELSEMFPETHFCKTEYFQSDDFYLDYNNDTSDDYTLEFDVNTIVSLKNTKVTNKSRHFCINPLDTTVKHTTSALSGDDPELNDALAWSLAKQITSESALRDLATLGLGVRDPTIDKNLTNKDDIIAAAHNVIIEWRKGQDNHKIAYIKLCKALRKEIVGMASYIKSVLEPTWKDQMSTGQ